MSREGRSFRAANGTPIGNFGQMIVHFKDADGRKCGIPFQVAAVANPLVGVPRMAAAGCHTSFQPDKGNSSTRRPVDACPSLGAMGCVGVRGWLGPLHGGPAVGHDPLSPPFPKAGAVSRSATTAGRRAPAVPIRPTSLPGDARGGDARPGWADV